MDPVPGANKLTRGARMLGACIRAASEIHADMGGVSEVATNGHHSLYLNLKYLKSLGGPACNSLQNVLHVCMV